MLVYRPDLVSYSWWHQVGGFNIKYPSYTAYKDSIHMLAEITKQNQAIIAFAHKHDLTWHSFTPKWIKDTFGIDVEVPNDYADVLVAILK